MSRCNAAFALNNVGQSDLFLQGPVIFALYLKKYLMDNYHTVW